ncbi:TPA: hypothetical protein ANIA_11660 [Aspergillus nidulans FGSC A4]|uniref:Uncharacterized protein n=1 Tax=Emericella nidulans (strain FGSC A4 / ATCC 38163 / CBS 112.46 / NRRL 194 / M139) TaxID=227321 RepID=C8VRL5_EMENI|nr:TPA: hypothetical protein ANIA_11660 [Aspergillus nidulans FGSC A4]
MDLISRAALFCLIYNT